MKSRLLIIVGILLIVTAVVYSLSRKDDKSMAKNKPNKINDTTQVEMDTTRNFTLNFDQGLARAVEQKKNMLVDFYTDWCHWCKVMDEKTFNDAKVAAKLNDRFITVRLNAESPSDTITFKGERFTNIELTRAFRVTGFPSLAFISPEQEIITVIPGYVPAEQFGYILDYIDKECYKKKISFEDFMKQKGDCAEVKTPDKKTD